MLHLGNPLCNLHHNLPLNLQDSQRRSLLVVHLDSLAVHPAGSQVASRVGSPQVVRLDSLVVVLRVNLRANLR